MLNISPQLIELFESYIHFHRLYMLCAFHLGANRNSWSKRNQKNTFTNLKKYQRGCYITKSLSGEHLLQIGLRQRLQICSCENKSNGFKHSEHALLLPRAALTRLCDIPEYILVVIDESNYLFSMRCWFIENFKSFVKYVNRRINFLDMLILQLKIYSQIAALIS